MKIIKKIIFWLFILLVVAAIAGIIVVGFFLGDLVKTAVQTVGPKVTKVSITLDKVTISLLSGSAGIKGLVVGNPQGYTTAQAISLGEASVGLSPVSLLSNKIVIHSVHVIAPDITIEGNLLNGNNNLSQILANVDEFNKTSGTNTSPATTSGPAKPAKKLEVDDFLISGAKVHYGATTLPLPDIHLTDLGTGDNGITAADLTKRILSQITIASIKAVGENAAKLGLNLEDLGKNLGQGAGKTIGSGVDKLKKGIGGFLGN
jgi:hypothetical protein